MLRVAESESAHDEVEGRCLLDEIAREGARRMLVAARETEVAAYLEIHLSASTQTSRGCPSRSWIEPTCLDLFSALINSCAYMRTRSGEN